MNEPKTCNACGNPQPLENFYRHKSGKLRAVCKGCMKAAARVQGVGRYRRNPAQAKARYRRWAKKNPEKVRQKSRRWIYQKRQRVRDAGQTFFPLQPCGCDICVEASRRNATPPPARNSSPRNTTPPPQP